MTAQESVEALVCSAHGEPSGLSVGPLALRALKDNEVEIEIEAAGISYVDVLMVRNLHQNKHATPFAAGMEAVGHVRAVGPAVTHVRPGDRVAALLYDGGHARRAIAAASETFLLPEACDPVRTAAWLSVALTAEIALTDRAAVKAGQTVLVGGAAGGVGLCAVQLAHWHGARVIAAASDEARCALARQAGADGALVYGEGFRERCQALNDGRDVDVIIDPVGGAFAEAAANLLDWDGRYVVIGFAGGGIPSFAANRLLVKNRAVLGMVLGFYRWQRPAILAAAAERVFRALAEGALDAPVTVVQGLSGVPAVMEEIAGRRFLGKAVVVP